MEMDVSERKVVSIEGGKPKASIGSKFKAGETVWLKDVPIEFNRPKKVFFADKDGVTLHWDNDVGDPCAETYTDDALTLDAPVKAKRPRKPKTVEIVFTPEFDK